MTYHFYNEKGRHLHTLNGEPLHGTSTLIKEIMPPFLAKWGAMCAVDHIKVKMISFDDGLYGQPPTNKYIIDLKDIESAVSAWTKTRDKAADKGTDMHSELEDYVQLCIEKHAGVPQYLGEYTGTVQRFAQWATSNVSAFLYAEAHTFSKECWVGGIVDCVSTLKTGEIAVIDFKSSKEVYYNHVIQAAGYALQINESGLFNEKGKAIEKPEKPVGALVVVPFGASILKPEIFTNVDGFIDAFKHLVEVYKLKLAFDRRNN